MAKRLPPTNDDVARVLESVASLLEAQGANPFRVASYRSAASTVRGLDRPLAEIFVSSGVEGLDRLPHVGRSLAGVIGQVLETGRLPLLERLQGQSPPEHLFATIPGIGPALAQRIHAKLGLETLEELEAAAHDGSLERLPGFGPRRARAVREVLASRSSVSGRLGTPADDLKRAPANPPIDTLLDVDREYRERAAKGDLLRIAPRRFNPSGKSWLPILHTERDGWTFTALHSNTARAHELGRTHDWVILVYEKDGRENQCTVVTETRGSLAGYRVVRGRESECSAHYAHYPEDSRAVS
ncbi:MAG TPA: helix-hairpin-helix domain-containing protein [Polyangiaceae bacterium]